MRRTKFSLRFDSEITFDNRSTIAKVIIKNLFALF